MKNQVRKQMKSQARKQWRNRVRKQMKSQSRKQWRNSVSINVDGCSIVLLKACVLCCDSQTVKFMSFDKL